MKSPRALAALIDPIARRALERRHPVLATLLTEWPVIVGPRLGAATLPEKLSSRPEQGGVLDLRVASADAVEVQHQLPLLIERINAFYGYMAIQRIKLVHGPVRRPQSAAAPSRPLAAGDAASIDKALAGIEDEELRRRLDALARAVFARNDD